MLRKSYSARRNVSALLHYRSVTSTAIDVVKPACANHELVH
jgi:hypothetical protein